MAFNINEIKHAQTLKTVYSKHYGQYNYSLAIEETSELSEEARSATKLGVGVAGKSRVATDTSTGIPLAHVTVDDQPVPIIGREIGYHITPDDEILSRLDDNFKPVQMRMEAAQKIFLADLHNTVMTGLEGNPTMWPGITNITLDPKNVKAAGVIFAATEEGATTQKVFDALRMGMGLVFERSNGNRVCNTLLMPTSAYVALGTRVFPENPSQTLLEAVFRAGQALMGEQGGDTSTRPFRIVPTHSIKTAMRLYDRNPEAIQFEVPMELKYGDYYYDGNNRVYPGRFRHTPLIVNDTTGIVELSGVAA